MPTLLHLRSSADLTASTSRTIGDAVAAAWRARGPEYATVVRDLHRDPLPHIADWSLHWAPELRPAGVGSFPEAEALQTALIDELLAADALLVEAPMYHWSIPSSLKAWIDHVHVGGSTAGSDETPSPLAGRRVGVVSARGAEYGPGTPTADWDHEIPALRILFERSFGMRMDAIVADLTLARTGMAFPDRVADSESQLTAALTRAQELGAEL